jgi:6,7-dimethyl-8-ribityllumazine synthase
MIKGVTLVRLASTQTVFDKMSGFFSAVGLEPGKNWADGDSKGAPFLAPVGNLEVVLGVPPATPEVLIEVTGLEDVYTVARRWTEQNYAAPEVSQHISEVQTTHWKSRLFTASPMPGHTFAFWEAEDPLHGRPLAMEGDLSAAGMRFGIVVARWNSVITDRLLQGALDGLLRSGAKRADLRIVRVPGAWEVPAAARTLAETKQVDAILTLACLLRGETAHYEAIYNEVARGIGQSQQETGVPHAFGVLTCETLEQALDRAGLKQGNKGLEAAMAAIEMVSLQRKIVTATVTNTAAGQD